MPGDNKEVKIKKYCLHFHGLPGALFFSGLF